MARAIAPPFFFADFREEWSASNENGPRKRAVVRGGAASDSVGVQALAHFLAWLEIGHPLGRHLDRFSGARVAPRARAAPARRERTEAAQFDPAALGQALGDFVEEDRRDLLNFLSAQIRIIRRQGL